MKRNIRVMHKICDKKVFFFFRQNVYLPSERINCVFNSYSNMKKRSHSLDFEIGLRVFFCKTFRVSWNFLAN